jgi:hypothetical protein
MLADAVAVWEELADAVPVSVGLTDAVPVSVGLTDVVGVSVWLELLVDVFVDEDVPPGEICCDGVEVTLREYDEDCD